MTDLPERARHLFDNPDATIANAIGYLHQMADRIEELEAGKAEAVSIIDDAGGALKIAVDRIEHLEAELASVFWEPAKRIEELEETVRLQSELLNSLGMGEVWERGRYE